MVALDSSTLALAGRCCGLGLAVFVACLSYQWLFPKIIQYPYPRVVASASSSDKQKSVLLAGSYNPPHLGHLEMLKYLSSRYGRVVAVVGFNPSKKYDITPQQRLELLERMISDAGLGHNVEARLVQGLIWRWASNNNIDRMYRGVRTWEVDGKDESYLLWQNTIWPVLIGPLKLPVRTIFLEGNPAFNHVSSSLIRGKCREARGEGLKPGKKDLANLVPECIAKSICEIYV